VFRCKSDQILARFCWQVFNNVDFYTRVELKVIDWIVFHFLVLAIFILSRQRARGTSNKYHPLDFPGALHARG